MALLCRLAEQGLEGFRSYLAGNALGPPPLRALSLEPMASPVDPPLEVEPRPFATRLQLGRYLHGLLADLGIQRVAQDVGLWSWLALFYFDQICPAQPGGSRRLRQHYSYILSTDYRHYYRHLVAVPCILVDLHGEAARCLLHPRVDQHGDFVEQLASRQEIITNTELIRTVDRLYFDPTAPGGGRPRRGATDRNRPGTLRRFIAVIQQLELTYDLHAIEAEQILALLPDEFDQWKQQSARPRRPEEWRPATDRWGLARAAEDADGTG